MFFLLGIKHRKFKENVQSQIHTFRTHFLTSYYMMDRVYFSLKTKWYTVDKGKKIIVGKVGYSGYKAKE